MLFRVLRADAMHDEDKRGRCATADGVLDWNTTVPHAADDPDLSRPNAVLEIASQHF